MSAIVEVVHALVGEVRTESSSCEVAVGAAAVAAVVLAGSAVAGRIGESALPGARVGWSALRGLVVSALFVLLAVQVAQAGWVTGADAAVSNWFVEHRSAQLTTLARTITDLGSPVGVAVVAVTVAVVLSRRRRSVVPAVFVLGTVGFAAGTSTLTKIVVARSRPPALIHLTVESDFSFPSGHTTGTTALLGTVLVLYVLTRPGWMRTVSASAVATLIVATVAATRLYLGVHWLSDVVGGAVLGTAVTLAATTLLLWLSPTVRCPDASAVGPRAEKVGASS